MPATEEEERITEFLPVLVEQTPELFIKFEEDKQKVAEMKSKQKFRPYWIIINSKLCSWGFSIVGNGY